MQKTYVFGHKNPDTDSVCASISMAYLKNQLGANAQPRVLGTLNKESKFVLDYFNVAEPQFLNDVKVQIRDMHYEKNHMIDEHASINDTYRKLADYGVTGLPLVDDKKKLTGYVNVKEISKYLIDGDAAYLNTSYDNIISTLNANEILRFDELIEGNILAAAYKSETFIDRINLDRNDILIVGDRYKIMEYAVSSGIKLLILVNNMELPTELYNVAKSNKVNVISVPMGTFKCSNMIKLCNFVKLININDHPITFSIYDFRDDFIDVANRLGHTNYPIIDKKNNCLGMLKLIDANTFTKKKVILVDHNQQSQSVDGVDEADIMEVIDHHNLGTIGTTMPINFRSMPVGCTCTVIFKMFQENNVVIPKDIAGLMLSAILSDTLMFKSPTTTELDILTGRELAKIAEVDIDEYGVKMFKAASSVAGMSVEEIINSDIKSFKYEDSNLAIGQVMTMDFEEIKKRDSEFVSALNTMCNMGNYKFAVLFVTDIIKNGSYIFFNEDGREEIAEAFNLKNIEQGTYLDGVVSRKKQMLPPLLEMLERRG
ncbi:MAG: putative manganese-dependent inorganic diphosphatase [Bacilli bacterium]|nr:putative manganese-dependent inorganic diphosphatase [Bacilli bacterium]